MCWSHHPYIAREVAGSYTRDRIRDAEAARTARAFRTAARQDRAAEEPVGRSTGPGRAPAWWRLVRRAVTA